MATYWNITIFCPLTMLNAASLLMKRIWASVNRQMFIPLKDAQGVDWIGCNIVVTDAEATLLATKGITTAAGLAWYKSSSGIDNCTLSACLPALPNSIGHPWSFAQSLASAGLTLNQPAIVLPPATSTPTAPATQS